MMLMRYTFREMRRRPGRTIFTLLGIVIGVQALVAIPITIQSTRLAHRELFEGLTGNAALEVVSGGESGFAPDIALRLESIEGVAAAVPVIQSTAVIGGRSDFPPVVTLGIDLQRDDQARDYVLASGIHLGSENQVLLEDSFARSLGLDVGATVRLLTPSGTAELQIVGLLEPLGAAAVNAGAIVIMPLSTSQRLYQLDGKVNSVNLVLADDAESDRIAEEISNRLPPGLAVQVPAARAALARESLASTELSLATLSIGSLVAGAFVILNSFLMGISERRRALAILRSLGATRRQVTRLLLSEAVALGVIGTAIGILVGLVVSFGLVKLMAQLAGPVAPHLQYTAGPFILACVLGPGMAVLATYVPARNAGRRSPLADLHVRPGSDPARDTFAGRWPSYLGIGLLASSAVIYTLIVTDQLPGGFYTILLPLLLVTVLAGTGLLLPITMTPLARLVEWLLRPVLGIEARLAVRQLRRHPTRTALVVGVLTISVITSVCFGNGILNAIRDVRSWNDRIFDDVDYLVIPTALSSAGLLPVSMPEEYADDIRELDGVRRVGTASVVSTSAAGHRITVFSRSCAPGEHPGFRFMDGVEAEALEGLRHGEVALGSTLARRTGLGRGDQISIETRHGTLSLRVAGLLADYTAGGMMVLLEMDHARHLFEMQGIHYLYVTAQPNEQDAVDAALRAYCSDHDLIVHSAAGFRATIDEMMAGMLGVMWVLLALVFVVASLGITNTLTMSVLEQTRELGLLRAVAMKRRQICKMILSQALAMSMISVLPGVVLGVLLGYAANRSNHAIVGVKMPYVLEMTFVLGCVGMALIVAVLASLPPARRAGRVTIIRALQTE